MTTGVFQFRYGEGNRLQRRREQLVLTGAVLRWSRIITVSSSTTTTSSFRFGTRAPRHFVSSSSSSSTTIPSSSSGRRVVFSVRPSIADGSSRRPSRQHLLVFFNGKGDPGDAADAQAKADDDDHRADDLHRVDADFVRAPAEKM